MATSGKKRYETRNREVFIIMMKKKLIIIGAGSVGGFISCNIEEFEDFEILGFLDDDSSKHDKTIYGYKVLGKIDVIDNYISNEKIYVVIGIANPFDKEKIAAKLLHKKVEFPNLISRNVWMSSQIEIGKGVIIYPGVSINYGAVLKDFVIINMNCAVGHNCIINDYSTLAPGVNLGGHTFIGNTSDIGIGVSTKQGVRIGDKSIIGGQSMVVKDVPEGVRVKGVPASIY